MDVRGDGGKGAVGRVEGFEWEVLRDLTGEESAESNVGAG